MDRRDLSVRAVVLFAFVVLAAGCAKPQAEGQKGTQVPTPTTSESSIPDPTLTPTSTSTATASPSPSAGYAVFSDPYGRFSFEYPESYWLSDPGPRDSYTVSGSNYDMAKASIAEGWGGRTKIDVYVGPRQGVSWELEGGSPTKIDGRDASHRIRRKGEADFPPDLELEKATIHCGARVLSDEWGFSIAVYSGEDAARAEDIFRHVLETFRLS